MHNLTRKGYTSKDRAETHDKMREERGGGGKKKKNAANKHPMPYGELDSDEEDEISMASQEAQEVLSWRYKKDNPYNPRDQFVPDAELIQLYKDAEIEGAKKFDDKYFRDGEFHGDEQKEKTKELLEAQIAELLFLEDPDDPGYWPPILHTWDQESWGPKAPVYMTEREDKDQKRKQAGKPNSPQSNKECSSGSCGGQSSGQGTGGGGSGGGKGSKGMPFSWDGKEDNENRFYIFPLTWDQIGTDWTIVVLGKRRSGKTVFIKSLCGNYLRPFFPRVYVFTKSFYSGEYAEFIPEAHIFPGLTPDEVDKKTGQNNEGGLTVLANIFKTQKKLKEASKAGKFHGNMNCLIIIDDCLSDGFRYQKLIDEVFFEGRHMNICFIVTSQDFKGVNPACTGNADMCTQFRCRSERDKEAVRTKFCDFFKNDEEFEQLTGQALKHKWHSVSYMQDKPHIDPRFTIFCGRPVEPEPFVMGCKEWWRENQKQLMTIIKAHPELAYLVQPNADWGIMGEEDMNEQQSHVPLGD